jgi:hypothetical protein
VLYNVLYIHRVHVVNIDTVVDLVPRNAEIAPIVSGDHMRSDLVPFGRAIELLVQVTIVTEGYSTDATPYY